MGRRIQKLPGLYHYEAASSYPEGYILRSETSRHMGLRIGARDAHGFAISWDRESGTPKSVGIGLSRRSLMMSGMSDRGKRRSASTTTWRRRSKMEEKGAQRRRTIRGGVSPYPQHRARLARRDRHPRSSTLAVQTNATRWRVLTTSMMDPLQ